MTRGKWLEFVAYFKLMHGKRLFNLVAVFMGHCLGRIVRRPVVWGMPFALSIEPTTACNLHCPECPTGNGTLKRSLGKMSLSLFSKIIGGLPAQTFHLNLYLQGEPLLNTQLPDFVKLARAGRLFTVLSTNAQNLDARWVEALVDAGLHKMIVSLDGVTQATYSKYRVGGDVQKVFDALGFVRQAKLKRGSRFPLVEIQLIAFAHNEDELLLLKEITQKYGADGCVVKTAQVIDLSGDGVQLPSNKQLTRYVPKNGIWQVKGRAYNHCFKINNSMVVGWNGAVSPCCMDKDMAHAVGDLERESVRAVWRSKLFRSFRQQVLDNRSALSICTNCTVGRRWYF